MGKLLLTVGFIILIGGAIYMASQSGASPQTLQAARVSSYQEYLSELAHAINDMKTSWTATVYSRWANYDYESLKKLNGVLPTPQNDASFNVPVVDTVAAPIPQSFNAATQWPNCASINEIRDQANCGSCWAFGAGEAMTDRWCIASGQKDNTRISMENILTCCTSCGFGCQGGYPIQAWQYWVSTGVPSGDGYGNYQWCQPYFLPSCGTNCPPVEANAPACSKACVPQYTGSVPYAQDFTHGKSAYSVANNVAAIQTEIMTNGPVEAAFTVYEDFYNYQGGVYVHKYGQQVGGHAIKIVGWGVDNGQPYWICANSWSSGWGMNGFFWILRGVDECGIESGVVAGLPNYAPL